MAELALLGVEEVPAVPDLAGGHLTAADLGLDIRVTQPDPAWAQHAVCAGGPLHQELTTEAREYATTRGHGWYYRGVSHGSTVQHDEGWYIPPTAGPRRWSDDLQDARETCLACPVMRLCRASAIHVQEVSGVAGGWTEEERAEYRDRHGLPTPDDGLDELDPTARLTPWLHDLVVRLTGKGWTAEEIAALVPSPDVDADTVAYVRQVIAGTKRRCAA